MHFDPSLIDPRFIAVDADAMYGDVVHLIGELSPANVVVREASGFGDLDDDEDDIFYVVASDLVLGLHASHHARIGVLAVEAGATPAPVLETVLGDVAGAAHVGERGPAVVLSEGIPDGLFHVRLPGDPGGDPPRDGSGEDDGGGGSEAFGVAVDYPKSVTVGKPMSLLIELTRDVSSPGVIPFVATAGDLIDIFVSPRAGFVVVGSPGGEIRVTAGAEALPVHVKLRATTVGVGSVMVYAFREGAAIGSLTITPEVLAEDGEIERTTATQKLGDDAPPDADLQLVILEQRDQRNVPVLLFLLTSRDPDLGLNLKSFGPVELPNGPGGYFTDLYNQIEQLPVETEKERKESTERLQAIGTSLFTDLFPDDLRRLLWELRDRIDTVWVQSAEPYVPWELCRLQGPDADGLIVEGGFFCEAFALTRWIPGIGRIPRLELSSVGVIVPGDSGLVSAPAEQKMLHRLARPGRIVADIPAEYAEVRNALASHAYDGIHFSGHGKFPDKTNPAKAEIELEGRSRLRPTDISGRAANLGIRNPFVFLNACQAGRQAPGLTGVGGWASALLKNGAAAFVGAHWEVTDDLALTFAETLYAGLDAGKTIAIAARDARIAIRESGDPTWLAYTVYADPGAALT